MASITLTIEQAQLIVDNHYGQPTLVASLDEVEIHGYSTFAPTKTYKVRLTNGTAHLLKLSHPPNTKDDDDGPSYAPNTLAAEHALLTLLSTHTSIPHASPLALDTSLALLPYPYLLLSAPRGVPLSHLHGTLDERQRMRLDLQIGAYIREAHEKVQNDWFGLPKHGGEELYSWQEAFTYMLEGALEDARAAGVDVPYESVRSCLSRAIGFFLFDDCEVPSLVSFMGDEGSIFVDFDPSSSHREGEREVEVEVEITAMFPLSHALWGDPLLEAMFLDPSDAFVEGYGGPLIVFERQKTKRVWYTLFLALVVIVQDARPGFGVEAEGRERERRVEWAKQTLKGCVEKLKDAPCY